MKIGIPLLVVVLLGAFAWVGTEYLHWYTLFGVVLPYAAFAIFVIGFAVRIIIWARSAVPFRIPTTTGQQKSLPWIKQAKIENPSSSGGVIGRMLMEVLFFRSLFRNSKTEKRDEHLGVASAKWLWLGALAFHWSMLIVVARHLRFFFEPVPLAIEGLEFFDGILQIGLPIFYITDLLIVAALTFLVIRRLVVSRVRLISLTTDFLPLFLLLAIACTGIAMRYIFRVDLITVKELTMGLVTFQPLASAEIGSILYLHLFMVCALLAYFPMSKLMHAGGVIMSPTRNMANNSREKRHVNPWNYKVKVHTYAEYEEEFGEKMKKVGLPLDAEQNNG